MSAAKQIMRALKEAAHLGQPCPSNQHLADLAGLSASNQASQIVTDLERRGWIQVERFQLARRITIKATGSVTYVAGNPAPHWRDRKARARWADANKAAIAEAVASGSSVAAAGRALSLTRGQAVQAWREICAELGPQAC